MRVAYKFSCDHCGGAGLVSVAGVLTVPCPCQDPDEPDSRHHKPHDCAACAGTGQRGTKSKPTTCRACGGCGRVVANPPNPKETEE